MGKQWTAIVLTCQDCSSAQAYRKELLLIQLRGGIPENSIVLVIEDPKEAVGSGGATLNALLVVAEHISVKHGYTVVNGDVLSHAHILILHMGRNFPYEAKGRAFVNMPLSSASDSPYLYLPTSLDILLQMVTDRLAINSPPGLWICSTDMILNIPSQTDDFAWEGIDVCAVTVPGAAEYATKHGVYKINAEGYVDDIVYQGGIEKVKNCETKDGLIPLVSGIVYVTSHVAEALLAFHVTPPMSACTYMGLDSGAQPIQLSIFFDIMLAMCDGVSQEDFVDGGCSEKRSSVITTARRAIWKELHGFKVKPWLIRGGRHSYMDMSCQTHLNHLMNSVITTDKWSASNRAHSFIEPGSNVSVTSLVINSCVESGVMVGEGSLITNSHLRRGTQVGHGCFINGVTNVKGPALIIPDQTVVECAHISLPTLKESSSICVYVAWHTNDNLMASVTDEGSTCCGKPWKDFFSATSIKEQDLWDDNIANAGQRSLYTASLFPVFHSRKPVGFADVLWLFSDSANTAKDSKAFQKWKISWRLSLKEIFSFVNVADEFKHSRDLFFSIGQQIVRDVLLNRKDIGLTNLYNSAVIEGYTHQILHSLDSVAKECNSPGIAARTLANIADMLGAMAQNRGGLRSGPAANKKWSRAFNHLEEGEVREGVQVMERLRREWCVREDLLVRAARHYEGAAQILIRHAVMTARKFINTTPGEPSPMDKWVKAECPARIDIAGGWSDTPPITYEHGGAVINAAIQLDGKKPIGAKVKRIPEPHLVLILGYDEDSKTKIVVNELSQLHDFNQPQAPGALLKAAFICADIIAYPSDRPLKDQLMEKYGSGFQLQTWSNLPHGSGLGTSSILASAVLAVLWAASGQVFTINSLNHAVVHLEQMLTTGGGWQDQIGGLSGGIKIGHSPAQLPLQIFTTFPNISPQTVQDFSDRLVLVYTGKTRLARNLLQNVVRNWYARDREIVETEDGLVENAWHCSQAFENGDIAEVGRCMNLYWQQKKKMAPGCEPLSVTRMMKALEPHAYGLSLAGAGGGGFLYVLTKEPNPLKMVSEILSNVEGTDNITVHEAAIDTEGITLTIQGQGQVKVKQMD